MGNECLIKNVLEKELERIKNRIQVLEMVELRLHMMRSLALKATDDNLQDQARTTINSRFQTLQAEVNLLNKEELNFC